MAVMLASQWLTGCAQFMAISQPRPFTPNLTIGEKRLAVMAELGHPTNTEEYTNSLTDVYRYTDGGAKNSGLSKTTRIILYTGGDIFTLWLDQIIWMPAEAFGFKGTVHAVTIDFARADDQAWHINRVDDQILKGGAANK